MRAFMKYLVSSSGFTFLLVTLAYATIRYVPQHYPTIQEGINAAVDGDTVLVADGIWSDYGNESLYFYGKAIVVKSQNGPLDCIIDCQYEYSRGFNFQGNEDTTSVVEGFTIQGGYCWAGAGIYCFSASPKILNCHIIENTAHPD